MGYILALISFYIRKAFDLVPKFCFLIVTCNENIFKKKNIYLFRYQRRDVPAVVLWAVYPPASPALEAWADQEHKLLNEQGQTVHGSKQLTNKKSEKQIDNLINQTSQ